MRKGLIILFVVIVCIVSLGAERREPRGKVDTSGMQRMKTTGYCVGHHTANGSAVHVGGCASSIDHIGDVAIVYSTKGMFLGYFECNDTGAEDGGVRAGKVLDVYFPSLEECKSWMRLTDGEVYVLWVSGNG